MSINKYYDEISFLENKIETIIFIKLFLHIRRLLTSK